MQLQKMKKLVVTHLFLNLYLLALIQPMYPILDYLLNYDYITQQLCENRDKPVLACNGKCYLAESIVTQKSSTSEKEQVLLPKADFDKLLTVRPKTVSFHFLDPSRVVEHHGFADMRIYPIFKSRPFKPPIA